MEQGGGGRGVGGGGKGPPLPIRAPGPWEVVRVPFRGLVSGHLCDLGHVSGPLSFPPEQWG